MAVISISKIQIRRGLQENLPQLSSGEMGWSIDQRRLFIGNGSLNEGAPIIGNTEILTEYSDILNVINSYYFKGSESGYTSQTGSSAFTPVIRTLQNKLDEDKVSVRDFGAIGDGLTDNTLAIQRAIQELYPDLQYSNEKVRRVLYFPAGVYNVNIELQLPKYISIVGDGINSTIIRQSNSTSRSLITFKDNLNQTSPEIGLNGAILPSDISISNLTLSTDVDTDLVYIDGCYNITFDNVKFSGIQINPISSGTNKALVRFITTTYPNYNIKFNGCIFDSATYAANINDNSYGITFNECFYNRLYQGFYLTGSSSYPRSIRVVNSTFDNISQYAVNSKGKSNLISAYNYYKNVGNQFTNNPITPVISNESPDNYSILDLFDRTSAQSDLYPTISSSGKFDSSTTYSQSSYGSLKTLPGSVDVILANSVLANTSLTLSSVSDNNAIIDYTVTRGSAIKTGTLTLSVNTLSSNQFYYEDDFVEYPAATQYQYGINSPTGTQLLFVNYGNTIVLAANTSISGGNVTFKYNIRKFK